jgi:hypothetical protein
MLRMKRALIVIGAALLLPAAVLVFQRFVLATDYAPGFSKVGFDEIKAGDTPLRVLKLLGAPYSTNLLWPGTRHSAQSRVWNYTNRRRADFMKVREVTFTNDAVQSKVKGIRLTD